VQPQEVSGMDIKVNVKRTYKVNDKDYSSLEEMPPDVRSLFDSAMKSSAGRGARGPATGKIVFNNVEYESIDEMPTYLRNIYEETLAAVSENREQLPAGRGSAPSRPTVPERAVSVRSLIITILIAVIAYAIYVFLIGK
jgi:hypothetical protein